MQRQQRIDTAGYAPVRHAGYSGGSSAGSSYTGGGFAGSSYTSGRLTMDGLTGGSYTSGRPAGNRLTKGSLAGSNCAASPIYQSVYTAPAPLSQRAEARTRQLRFSDSPERTRSRRAAARARRRKKRRRHGLRLLISMAACLCLTLFGGAVARLCLAAFGGASAYPTLPIAVSSIVYPLDLGGAWDADTEAALRALAARRPEVQPMLDDPAAWPADVAALLARNEEALDFVLAYPSLVDTVPPDTVEEAQKGAFPALLQWDARWGAAPYAGSILALSGCGPTVLSVVACGLTGSGAWTPAAIAEWAQGWGYATGSGTSWDLMRSGCEHFGVKAEELSLSETTVFRALEAGSPVICSVRPGDFTTTGHFIVLTGTENGLIRLVDPNSPERSGMLWEWDRLMPQIKNLWAYTAI